jgi:hypothetical protein
MQTAHKLQSTQSISCFTHISEIQEDHLKHLDIEVANNRYFYLQSLKFNPAILEFACQDITFQTSVISDKFLSTIQQLQVKQLSPNYLQGSTMVELYKPKTEKWTSSFLHLRTCSQLMYLTSKNCQQRSLTFFLHEPIVNLMKLLKFFQFI